MRLFKVAASEIVEYPTDLSVEDPPLGPIEGWECYAPSFHNKDQVIGPFTAIIQEGYPGGNKYIAVPGEKYLHFYFRSEKNTYPAWPCLHAKHPMPYWAESGMTLRFIKCKE